MSEPEAVVISRKSERTGRNRCANNRRIPSTRDTVNKAEPNTCAVCNGCRRRPLSRRECLEYKRTPRQGRAPVIHVRSERDHRAINEDTLYYRAKCIVAILSEPVAAT